MTIRDFDNSGFRVSGLWQAVQVKSPPQIRQVPVEFAAGTCWIHGGLLT
ncbi:14500_t:CDS:2 [Rhizophagus irregularis]|nr:14500_t:CDS:2 [Rhizophagus irregularis]